MEEGNHYFEEKLPERISEIRLFDEVTFLKPLTQYLIEISKCSVKFGYIFKNMNLKKLKFT
jgi:hypothetical protein